MKSKIYLVAVVTICLVSCSSPSRRSSVGEKPLMMGTETTSTIERLLRAKAYTQVLAKMNVKRGGTSSVVKSPQELIYQGRAFLGLKQLEGAENSFRKVLRYGKSASPIYQALAHYNLSYVYELRGDIERTISVLIGARRWSDILPPEIREVELPARLAAAYLRLGNRKEATRYFKKADQGIKRLKEKTAGTPRDQVRLAQVYYSAGNLGDIGLTTDNLLPYLIAFERSQEYLLIAAASGDEPWAGKASRELQQTYERFANVVMSEGRSSKKNEIAAKKNQAIRVNLAIHISEALDRLQALIIEEDREKEAIQSLENFIATYQNRLDEFILNRPVGEGLTKEAEKFESLKRGGTTE